jgi:lipopolysaccharide export system protein LptC
MTASRFFSLVLLAIAATSIWWLEDLVSTSQTEAMKQQTNRPDFYMENFTLRNFDANGELHYRAKGKSLIRYPQDGSLAIEQLDMLAYKEDKAPLQVKSNTARISNNGDHAMLTGAVDIHRDKLGKDDALTIKTEKLFMDNQRNYLETNKAISIWSGRHQMHGTGMQAWLDHEKYRLLSNVRGIHEP